MKTAILLLMLTIALVASACGSTAATTTSITPVAQVAPTVAPASTTASVSTADTDTNAEVADYAKKIKDIDSWLDDLLERSGAMATEDQQSDIALSSGTMAGRMRGLEAPPGCEAAEVALNKAATALNGMMGKVAWYQTTKNAPDLVPVQQALAEAKLQLGVAEATADAAYEK